MGKFDDKKLYEMFNKLNKLNLNESYGDEDIAREKLISKAHTDLTRGKGRPEYKPNAREIEDQINNNILNTDDVNESTDLDNYENIVFIQGEEADEPLQILDEKGPDAALEYLKQWHNPGQHEGTEELGHGGDDEVYEKDGYIMSWNSGLNYIGLQYDLSNLYESSVTEDKIEDEKALGKKLPNIERELEFGKMSDAYRNLLKVKPSSEIRRLSEYQIVLSSLRDLITKSLNVMGVDVTDEVVQNYYENTTRVDKKRFNEYDDDPLADVLLGYKPKNVNEGVSTKKKILMNKSFQEKKEKK